MTTHRLGKEAYDLTEDVLLVVMEEVIVPQSPAAAPGARGPFTEVEWKILRIQMDTGGSHKEIAAHLGRSVRTVDTHMANIKKRAGVHSSKELMVWLKGRAFT